MFAAPRDLTPVRMVVMKQKLASASVSGGACAVALRVLVFTIHLPKKYIHTVMVIQNDVKSRYGEC